MAFKKIRTISKTFNSNLISTPTELNLKYKKINQTYLNDNSFLVSNNYGLTRQHNLLSLKSNLSKNNIFLDSAAFKLFLENHTSTTFKLTPFTSFNYFLNLTKEAPIAKTTSYNNLINTMGTFKSSTFNQSLFNTYERLITTFNDNSDKTIFQYPLRKIFNQQCNTNNFTNKDFVSNSFINNHSQTISFVNNRFQNNSKSNKTLTLLSSNQNILPSDQNLRQYDNLLTNKLQFNLSGKTNTTLDINQSWLNQSFYNIKSNFINATNFYKLTSNQTTLTSPYAPILTTNDILANSLNFDTSNILTEDITTDNTTNSLINHTYNLQKSNSIGILKGKRDGAPEFLNSAY
jgi:hypothetical protein